MKTTVIIDESKVEHHLSMMFTAVQKTANLIQSEENVPDSYYKGLLNVQCGLTSLINHLEKSGDYGHVDKSEYAPFEIPGGKK